VTRGSLKQSVFRLPLEMVCPENWNFNFSKSFCGQFNKNDNELSLSQIGRSIFYRFYCFPQQELITFSTPVISFGMYIAVSYTHLTLPTSDLV